MRHPPRRGVALAERERRLRHVDSWLRWSGTLLNEMGKFAEAEPVLQTALDFGTVIICKRRERRRE